MNKNTLIKILFLPLIFSALVPGSVSAQSSTFSIAHEWYYSDLNMVNIAEPKKKVVVAILDDGVYIGHPALQNNIWLNQDEIQGNFKDDDGNGYIDDRWGWDFVMDSHDMTIAGTHGDTKQIK